MITYAEHETDTTTTHREGDGMSSLGEEYPKEQARVREVLGIYKEIGPVGAFGAHHIEQTLKAADEAALSGDLTRMIVAFEDMKSITG